jgi:hypothetical protein
VPVIDVDSHFEPGSSWLDDHPRLRDRLPVFDTAEVTTKIVAGDILADVPRDEWPTWEQLAPPGIAAIAGRADKPDDYGYEGSSMHGASDAAARVAWLDRNGIDLESVICLEGMINARFLDDRELAREVVHTCNTWLAEAVEGHTDRLLPVTCLDFSDVDAAVAEMTRMRARGSRTFMIGTIPVPGVPIVHPMFEPIWSAATDLGMIAMLHVLIAECGLHWFAGTVDHMEARDARRMPEARLYMGDYPFDLSPAEFVRRNVRVTPLPRAHQSPAPLLATFPECVVFSSDYNHNEGSGSPTAYYDELLADLDPSVRAGFLGGTIAASYARMGDPLPLPVTAR